MSRLKSFFTDKKIALLIRWWSVGAIYFFIGWGTNLGQTSMIDYVFFLGLGIALFNMFVVNPIIKHMLNVLPRKAYGEQTLAEKVGYRLSEVLKAVFIVTLIMFVYNIINIVLIQAMGLSPSSVPFPGEPITFGILYVLIWSLLDSLIRNVREKVDAASTQ